MELKKLTKFNLRGYWSQVLINSTISVTFQPLQVSSLSFTKQIDNLWTFKQSYPATMFFKVIQYGYETFENVAPILYSVICSE